MPLSEQINMALVSIPENPAECWEWNGSINKRTGYGKKTWNGKVVLAHRWMFELLQGPIPNGLVINHKCGNRSCVNPAHLEIVDQAGNCRHGRGAKLGVEDVIEIKQARDTKRWGTAKMLAEKYKVSNALIHDIWNGRAWKDISP